MEAPRSLVKGGRRSREAPSPFRWAAGQGVQGQVRPRSSPPGAFGGLWWSEQLRLREGEHLKVFDASACFVHRQDEVVGFSSHMEHMSTVDLSWESVLACATVQCNANVSFWSEIQQFVCN